MSPVVDIIIRTIDQSGGDVGKLTGKLGELATKYLSVGAVAGLAYKTISDSIKTTLDYANSVRQLSQISGESTENTSRFIQVLDDYKISASDALVATRALTKEGHTPSIETLAKLSDEYLALNSAEEKNEFILKNLGRGGLQWVEVLNKGSKALLEQGEAVNQNLILSQKMVDAARRNEIAVDNWNDSVQALKISIGNEAIPVLTNFVNGLNASQRAHEILAEQGKKNAQVWDKDYTKALAQAKEEQKAATDAMMKNADAADALTGSLKLTEEELKAQEEAIKAVTKANQDTLSTLGELTGEINDYSSKQTDLIAEHDELLAKKQKLISEGWWAESEKVQEVNKDLAENEAAQAKNADEFELATKRRILARTEEMLAQDGLTAEETSALIEQGKAWGVYSEEAAARMKAIEAEAANLVAKYNSIPKSITTTITTNYVANYSTNYIPGEGLAVANPNPNQHASGGVFTIPESYGYEGFRMGGGDTASGGEKLAIAPEGKDIVDYKRMGTEIEKAFMRAMTKVGG